MTDDPAVPQAPKNDPFRVTVTPDPAAPFELGDAALDGVAGGAKPGEKSCGEKKGG